MKGLREKLAAFTVTMLMAMLTIVTIPTVVHAQSQMSMKVPFEFYVGTHKLPSGNYRIEVSSMYVKVSDGAGHSAYALTNPVSSSVSMSEGSGQLVFTRYDDYFFLSEVRRGGYSFANGLLRSDLEVQIAKTSTNRIQLAYGTTR